VGGIPEILPDSMLFLSKPSVSDLIKKIEFAIDRHLKGNVIDPLKMHDEIKHMYNWRDVARRTEIVYDLVDSYKIEKSLAEKLAK
jgi:phosphatidylinositol glycan class A protein